MGKTEHQHEYDKLVTSLLETDLDTVAFAQILGVTEADLQFFTTIEKRNKIREQNIADEIAKRREAYHYFEYKPKVQKEIKDFLASEASKSEQQQMQRAGVKTKMIKAGLNDPDQILDLLTENTAALKFFDIGFSEMKPKIVSYDYDAITSDFIEFLADLDNPALLLDRLNKLKVNVSTTNIGAQREKATELLNIICQIPGEQFQKAVSDLNEFRCIQNCDIIKDDKSDLEAGKNLDKELVARLRILQKGGLTYEEKNVLKRLDNDSFISSNITDYYGLETVLDNKELFESIHIVLYEEARVSKVSSFFKETIDKVKMLEERGVLRKLSTIFSSGIEFSTKHVLYGTSIRTVMNSIILHDEYELKKVNNIIKLIELTYDNLTNKEFILMRAFLGIFTIEDSYLVKNALELFQITKTKIEALSSDEKRSLFKSLRSNQSYSTSVPDTFTLLWKNWISEYDDLGIQAGSKKVRDSMLGLLRLHDDLGRSQLEIEIKQQQNSRAVHPRVREDIYSINRREAKRRTVGYYEFEALPIDTVRIDRDHVVDQSMDIIQLSDSKIRIQLFLTEEVWKSVLNVLTRDPGDPKVSNSSISYSGRKMTNAVAYEPLDGLVISVSSGPEIRATIGLVDITVNLTKIDKDTYIQEINSALSYLVGLGTDENLLSPTDEKSDELLVKELYKLNTKKTTPPEDIKFERRAISDGYETIVIPDRHKAYKEKYGSFATFHRFYNTEGILQVLSNGMLSSHQRYRQGILVDGWSTWEDFKRGGANSVFTRTISEHTEQREFGMSFLNGINLIFNPKIWDRLDFYLYSSDCFGNTSDEFFKNRLSPEEYLSQIADGTYGKNNEQMFRRCIPIDMFMGILVRSRKEKAHMIKELKEAGIFNINGKSLNSFIHIYKEDKNAIFEAIDIAEGLPMGTTNRRKNREIMVEKIKQTIRKIFSWKK